MSWRQQYFSILSNYYWNPKYLGLESIQWRKLPRVNGAAQIPIEKLNQNGPIYTRRKKHADLVHDLNRYEEILNHFFNITFSITPDALIAKLFCSQFNLPDKGPFSYNERLELGWEADIVQPDAFILSKDSAIAIELKLGSLSSREQVLKYLIILAHLSMSRSNLSSFNLLFICPEGSSDKLLNSCGLMKDGRFTDNYVQDAEGLLRKKVRAELDKCRTVLDRLMAKVAVKIMSWSDLYIALNDVRRRLHSDDPYQQTLSRLLDGFLEQLKFQRDSNGITDAQLDQSRLLFKDALEAQMWAEKLDCSTPQSECDRRKSLIGYVCTTNWGGVSVIRQCEVSTTDELETFVAALKDGKSPISLKFRWASDFDTPIFSSHPLS